jgi:hypothetical protein
VLIDADIADSLTNREKTTAMTGIGILLAGLHFAAAPPQTVT